MNKSRTESYSPLEGESKRVSRFGGGSEAFVKSNARQLRKAVTPLEVKLWARLKRQQLGVRFRRQHPVGPYIADFICLEHKIIVELDGSQHQQQQQTDASRNRFLLTSGYRVLRFWNSDIDTNIPSVLESIMAALAPHQNAARFDSPSRGVGSMS